MVVFHAEGFAWPVYASYYVWDGVKMKLVKKEKKEPNQPPEPTAPSGRGSS
jgi:hypothetical protein